MNTSNAPSRPRARVLALALATALCGVAAMSAAAAASLPYATVAVPTQIRNGDAVVGALPATQILHLVLVLKPRDQQGLDALVAQQAADQQHGRAPRLLTPETFLSTHAPSAAQAQAVADFLGSHGFGNVSISPNRMVVSADGSARAASEAFMTRLVQVRTRDGRFTHANADDVRLPAAIADKVVAVVGLQDVHRPDTPVHAVVAASGTGFVHDPNEWQQLYGGNASADPANVVLGIVTYGNLTNAKRDFSNWALLEGYDSAPPTQTINTGTPGSDTSGNLQTDIDDEDAVGLSNDKVKKVIFYNMPDLSEASLTANLNTIVNANATKLVIASLGWCETDAHNDGSAAAQDALLQVAVSQGQTFVFPTGDSGADECPSDGLTTPVPRWPASSQYGIAVAGTTLLADESTDTWSSETAWAKTGGSSSTFEPMPAWQQSFSETIGATTHHVPGTTRAAADVAFDANPKSGVLYFAGPGLVTGGGTGLAGPIFAGVWARVLQAHPGIGFAGPVIYALPRADFHDVTSGNNGSAAHVSYDVVSGRGSMIIDSVIADSATLGNQKPVANWSDVATSLSVQFTDTSTDSDGTVVFHAWQFGDGAVSNLANPTHAYATAGTYSVTETVRDNDGAQAWKVRSITIGP